MSAEKNISTLLRKLKRAFGTIERTEHTPMEEFVLAFLVWEAPTARAEAALKRLLDSAIDINELRVTRVEDLAAIIGKTYPASEERSERLWLAMNDLYKKEHAVSLDRIVAMNKRDARKYLDDLDGMLPFISARIALLAIDAHAVPIDQRTLELLEAEGYIEEDCTIEKAIGKLERHIKSTEAIEAHLLLQQWAENEGDAPASKKRSKATKSGAARTTKKKPTRRKTTAK